MIEEVLAAEPAGPTQKIHKILAQSGLGSRREMEEMIRAGKVTVNGVDAIVGMRVNAGDVLRVGRRQVTVREHAAPVRIIVYHKPEGEIVSYDDPEGRPSVFAKLPPIRLGKWLAVGRLDFNTSGLLIFTNSGEFANRLMHPKFDVEREYAVRVIGQPSEEQCAQLLAGVSLEDGMSRFDVLEERGGQGLNHWYRVVLREGRNRIVRRTFEALGFTVSRLMRVRFGLFSLPFGLRRGAYRELEPQEVEPLLEWVFTLNPDPVDPETLMDGEEAPESAPVPQAAHVRRQPLTGFEDKGRASGAVKGRGAAKPRASAKSDAGEKAKPPTKSRAVRKALGVAAREASGEEAAASRGRVPAKPRTPRRPPGGVGAGAAPGGPGRKPATPARKPVSSSSKPPTSGRKAGGPERKAAGPGRKPPG